MPQFFIIVTAKQNIKFALANDVRVAHISTENRITDFKFRYVNLF